MSQGRTRAAGVGRRSGLSCRDRCHARLSAAGCGMAGGPRPAAAMREPDGGFGFVAVVRETNGLFRPLCLLWVKSEHWA